MNIVKRIAVTLLVLILTFSITGCGNVKEKTSERVSDKTSAEEKKDGKTFQAEDLVSMDEMSTITGVSIVDTKLWDNDYLGLLGATYLVEKDGYDGFDLNCYQQSYRGVANDDIGHPVFSDSVKTEYEEHKKIIEDNGCMEAVEALGQDAYYDTSQHTLHILYNDDYYIKVSDDYSDDPVTRKETAIKIAKKALNRLSEKL